MPALRHCEWIAISEIADLEESPLRLSPKLGAQIYRRGETGMGSNKFRVDFAEGRNTAVVTGGAVDFIPLPEDATGADVLRVHFLTGYDEHLKLAPRYY